MDGGSKVEEEDEVPIPTRGKGSGGKIISESETGGGEGERLPLPSMKRMLDKMGIVPHEAEESERDKLSGLSKTRAVE